MRNKSLLASLLSFITVISFYCTNPTEPESGANLLKNPSFEINGEASFNGWANPSAVNFSNDVPPGGGKWSLYINSYSTLPAVNLYANSQIVKSLNGIHIYTFSFWAKYKTIPGRGYLITFKGDSITTTKFAVLQDTSWTYYSIVDTVFSGQTDSIMVKFYQGNGEAIQARSYFDLCTLSAR